MLTILTVPECGLKGIFYNHTKDRQVAILYIRGKQKLVNNRAKTKFCNLKAIKKHCKETSIKLNQEYSLITYKVPLTDHLVRRALGEMYSEVVKEIGKI